MKEADWINSVREEYNNHLLRFPLQWYEDERHGGKGQITFFEFMCNRLYRNKIKSLTKYNE